MRGDYLDPGLGNVRVGACGWMRIGTVLITLHATPGASDALLEALFVPLPLNEIALALWLIVKGFDRLPTTDAR